MKYLAIIFLLFNIINFSCSKSRQNHGSNDKDDNLEKLMDFIKINIENENKSENSLNSQDKEETGVFDSNIDNLVLLFHRFDYVLKFMEHNSGKLNVDGLYGVRIAQGVFENFLKELDNKYSSLNDSFIIASKSLIRKFSKRIYLLVESSINDTIADNAKYFEYFSPLITKIFYIEAKDGLKLRHNDNLIESEAFTDIAFSENTSDACYELLLGTADEDNKKADVCTTSDFCFNVYTIPNTSNYFLTHQLLYFLLSNYMHCTDKVVADLKKFLITNETNVNLKHMLNQSKQDEEEVITNYYCSKVYKNVEENVKKHKKLHSFPKDLFIEQLLLCSMLGYNEFLNPEWFKLILKFQQKNGCFGSEPAGKTNKLVDDDTSTDIYSSMQKIYGSYYLRNPMNQPNYYFYKRENLRSKRFDKEMGSHCSSHETGIAFALYSLYIKFNLKSIIEY